MPTTEQGIAELEAKVALLMGDDTQSKVRAPWWEHDFGEFKKIHYLILSCARSKDIVNYSLTLQTRQMSLYFDVPS